MYRATYLGAFLALAASITFSASTPAQDSAQVRLRYEAFDPLAAEPEIPATLRNNGAERLFIVQFAGTPTAAGRAALAAASSI